MRCPTCDGPVTSDDAHGFFTCGGCGISAGAGVAAECKSCAITLCPPCVRHEVEQQRRQDQLARSPSPAGAASSPRAARQVLPMAHVFLRGSGDASSTEVYPLLALGKRSRQMPEVRPVLASCPESRAAPCSCSPERELTGAGQPWSPQTVGSGSI